MTTTLQHSFFSYFLPKKNCYSNIKDKPCEVDSDCKGVLSTCSIESGTCLCKNGASNYPTCSTTTGKCDDCNGKYEYCSEANKCVCRWGGEIGECCKHECTGFMTCQSGECECTYGKGKNDVCRRCEEDCGENGVCRKQGNKKIDFILLRTL